MNQKNSDIKIILGEKRFAGSSNNDMSIKVGLTNKHREFVEGDRTTLLNLEERFNTERQDSTKIRISGKITNIFENIIDGISDYEPFLNDLYYTVIDVQDNNSVTYRGLPQYKEFSFFRNEGINGHINFLNKSADTYNWMLYISYPSKNQTNQSLRYTTNYNGTQSTLNYNVSDGIPYIIRKTNINGKKLITFFCAHNHNLSKYQWVYLNNEVQGKRYFQVYSLGDKYYGNENKVFSIFDYGYTDALFGDGNMGTFKRVLDPSNPEETTSEYYVRKHNIITKTTDYEINKMGFERNVFPSQRKINLSGLTPDNTQKVTYKEDTLSFAYTFSKDIDISLYRDNLGRPITELFLTVINKGYMGWFNNPQLHTRTSGLQVGWDFNFQKQFIDNWWDVNNLDNDDNIPSSAYGFNDNVFYYNEDLKIGDEIKGDICEFNKYEQKETVLSKINHKISFNPNLFNTNGTLNLPEGYGYQVHYPIKLRSYSNYVEKGVKSEVDFIPDFSFYSNYDNEWRWRDLYPYGFVDSENNGTDIPFLNGCHYPFKQINFLLKPMSNDNNDNNLIIFQPTTDDCE